MKKRAFVRRLLALATAAVMLLSAVPAMAAFRDTAGHWAEKTLTEWQELGLIDGYSDGSFRPNAPVTRAEFVKLLNRALNFTAESAISFTDVKESDWFYAEAAKAAAAGYAQGSNGEFRPELAITRAEAAAMIARAVSLTADEKRADAFTDAAAIPAWAKGSVGAAAESGYMNGYPDGTFGAGNYITRAEAVVTLDRMRKDVQSVTVEKAGTTLENETVAGNLIIAASVGEGNVTLKNMTIRGDMIVRGGGANSVYLDGVEVGGSVRLQKENVHLRLMGDTALGSVEISQPCRITRDGSFKGALGTVVIDLEKDSIKEIQIEVPAERVEVVSCANVALNADVEKLVLSADAEGAQLEIRRGATVGELTADAKAKLTGSGTVSSLVVSANDVTVRGSLSVKKTETTDGAKEPTVSGGSSGSSGRVLKEITGIAPITAEVPYGTSGADALKKLPAEITLNVKDGSEVKTTAAGWNWADGTNYEAKPAADTAYTAATAFTVLSGYTYSGAKTAAAAVTVKALDTSAFDAALKEAQALKNGLTDSETAAAADPANKIFVTSETNAANITEGVRFTTGAARAALEAAIADANNAKVNFASQQACDDQAKALTDAVAAFTETIGTGTSTITDGYTLNAAKKWLKDNRARANYAYDSANQPLKQGTTYELPVSASLENGLSVKFEWSKNDSTYLEMKQDNSGGNYSLTVKQVPTEPENVTFTATVKRYDIDQINGTLVGTIDYTATIGAPIIVDSTATVTVPKLVSGAGFGIEIHVPLKGGAADITNVKLDEVSALGNKNVSESIPLSITSASIIKNGEYRVEKNGLYLPVTAQCGYLPVKLNSEHSAGKINITIPSDAIELKDGSGWYVPNGGLSYDAEVWGYNPTISVTTQTATEHSGSSWRKVSVNMTYMFEIRKVTVKYKTAEGREMTVTFLSSEGKWDPSVGQNGIVYSKDVQFDVGDYTETWVMVDKDSTWLKTDNLAVKIEDSSSTGGEDTP